ncbi:MAG: hypothetical protein JWM89_1298 [Acidimicrobiales bacterium]|nr:hypothetical protein [Acidimicrobiales bacterium]
MTTTSMTNAWNRLNKLHNARRDLALVDATPSARANRRFNLGIADDADLDIIDPQIPEHHHELLAEAFATDGRSWYEQLIASPAERLAVDVATAENRAQLLDALKALRRLARHGDFRTNQGWRQAEPAQRSYARVLLRRLVQIITSNAKHAAETGENFYAYLDPD